jgi:hypothetical protein
LSTGRPLLQRLQREQRKILSFSSWPGWGKRQPPAKGEKNDQCSDDHRPGAGSARSPGALGQAEEFDLARLARTSVVKRAGSLEHLLDDTV